MNGIKRGKKTKSQVNWVKINVLMSETTIEDIVCHNIKYGQVYVLVKNDKTLWMQTISTSNFCNYECQSPVSSCIRFEPSSL